MCGLVEHSGHPSRWRDIALLDRAEIFIDSYTSDWPKINMDLGDDDLQHDMSTHTEKGGMAFTGATFSPYSGYIDIDLHALGQDFDIDQQTRWQIFDLGIKCTADKAI